MKNQENKSAKTKSADSCCGTNHHANPSAINHEVEAMRGNEHSHKDSSKLQEHPGQNKRDAAREVHTNGSTPKRDQ